jgi:aspartyl-tRNA(Asn)/glutamyl-tRNA(Gln) amidotransferase subunit B
MEKGQLRCDANISIRPEGATYLGCRVELKNLNSISGVCNGVRHEIQRQICTLERGEKIQQQTRRWEANRSESFPMRTKEDAQDYRYFTDPDLCPICLSEDDIEVRRKAMVELPFAKQERYLQDLRLPYTVTSVLCPDKHLSDFFEAALEFYPKNPLAIANWIANDLLRELAALPSGMAHGEILKLTPRHVADLVELIDQGALSKQSAKEVFIEMFSQGRRPREIVEEKNLGLAVNSEDLMEICRQVIVNFPKPAEEFRAGKEKALNVLKGQVMKQTQGKAPATAIDRHLRELLLH